MNQYAPILIAFALAAVTIGLFLGLSFFFGPKREHPVKAETFECGNPPIGTARQRFAVKFYVVAMLFLLFDIEVVFLLPWAVLVKPLGWMGFVEMTTFLGVLVLGLLYVWRKGALDWE